MPGVVWHPNLVTAWPLSVSGKPAANLDCCCPTDICADELYWWSTEKMTTPDEYNNDQHAFGYPNYDERAFGDQSRSGTVYGGPLRTSHLAIRWASVDVPQGHTFNNVQLTFQIYPQPSGNPIDCSGRINLRIAGYDIGNAPSLFAPFPNSGADYYANVKDNLTTGNWVDWQQVPKPDPVQCGISQVTTPNIAGIINEILNRPDWVSGNAFTIIVEGFLHHVTQTSGTYQLHQATGTLTRSDGGSFLADGFRIGQNVRMDTPGEELFINCIRDVGVTYIKWSIGPQWWPNNGTRFATLDAYVVACAGFPGAQTPEVTNGDYRISIQATPSLHCILAQ